MKYILIFSLLIGCNNLASSSESKLYYMTESWLCKKAIFTAKEGYIVYLEDCNNIVTVKHTERIINPINVVEIRSK